MKKNIFSKADILRGLQLKQFEVYYQPIIDKKIGTIICGEALIRWNHPKLGLLHPDIFIPIAESNGAILALGDFVLLEACEQSKIWSNAGHSFYKVTVNLSFAQILEKDFVKNTISIITASGIDPHNLELEITETMAMIDQKDMIAKLQKLGVRIILDDFGTGYSSLSHLKYLPFNGLKIDRRFIKQSLESTRDSKLMHSIILLAQSIDLHIVAEGVETKEQLDMLEKMNCHTVQGFYFTHPLPSKEYSEWCTYFLRTPELQVY